MKQASSKHPILTTVALAVLAASFALAVAGCGGSGDTTASSSGDTGTEAAAATSVQAPPNLVDSGKLTLGTDFTYPPYESIEGSEQVGFDVDLAAEIAATMGLEPEMIDTRFSSLIPGLSANRFDAI